MHTIAIYEHNLQFYLYVFQWPTDYWFSAAIFAGLLHRQMLNSSAHFTSRRPRRRLPSGDQVIRLGHRLTSMHTTCPYHFNILFSILSKIICVTPIFF